MCGIIGYLGTLDAAKPLYAGLRALSYRGYDSAGVATVLDGRLLFAKQPGKQLELLEEKLAVRPSWGTLGIAHTRWATHGEPSERNAHPHTSPSGKVAIVHNGMVENWLALKDGIDAGALKSETDTEVIACLIERELPSSATLSEAVRKALGQVAGAYAIAAISADRPDELVVAANGSPLVIGTTNEQDEWFVASDPVAFPRRVRLVEFLKDGEMALLARGRMPSIESALNEEGRESCLEAFDTREVVSEKGAHAHFMRKELADLPESLRNTLRGHLGTGNGKVHIGAIEEPGMVHRFRDAHHVVITGCGTSLFAGQVGKLLIQQFARIRTETEDAATWRYGAGILDSHDIFISVSQSGETKDVLEAFRRAKALGAITFAINNRVGSQLARESERGMYLHAGPEVAVASTKAFACQVAALALIAAKLAILRGSSPRERIEELISGLEALPGQLALVLAEEQAIESLAREYADSPCIPIIARGFCEPVAREGALKLQEVAYRAGAHGWSGSELKHGPIALLEPKTPVIAIVPKDGMREKMLGNVSEAHARGADIIALTTGEDEDVSRLASAGRVRTIAMPQTCEELYPVLAAPILQLFAYHMGLAHDIDVDKPRNLAKSVTVE